MKYLKYFESSSDNEHDIELVKDIVQSFLDDYSFDTSFNTSPGSMDRCLIVINYTFTGEDKLNSWKKITDDIDNILIPQINSIGIKAQLTHTGSFQSFIALF